MEHYIKCNQTVKTQCVLYADLRVELLGENTKPLIRVNQLPRRTTGYRLNSTRIPFCQLQMKPVITTSVMRHQVYCVSYSVLPINSSPLTILAYSSVRETLLYTYSLHGAGSFLRS